MPTLHVRNVPEDLHKQLQILAKKERMSLTAEVLKLLETAVDRRNHMFSQKELLDHIRKNRYVMPKGKKSSLELLNEDRAR